MHLALFFEEQQVIDLWNELPNVLKTLFCQNASSGECRKKDEREQPYSSMWLKIFEELGWCEQRGNVE